MKPVKPNRSIRALLWMMLLLVVADNVGLPARGQTPLPNTTPTVAGVASPILDGVKVLNQELTNLEKDEDRQHLKRIYQAIIAYYRDHQDLPNWLSDLVPQYLKDASDLISPVEKRTGKSVLYGREDPNLQTSYIYEFNAAVAPEEFNRGRAVPLTCKEWKLMQLKKFGLVTPLVRCHLHNPVLNLAYSGDIFESGLLWENDPRTAALIRKNPLLGPQAGNAPGVSVSVKATDADTGIPIEAALVHGTLGSEFGILPPAQGTTGTNGVFAIPLGEWKINFLILSVSHPLYQTRRFEWNREKTKEESVPNDLVLRLTRRSTAAPEVEAQKQTDRK